MATEPAAVTGKGPPGLQAINCACSSLYPDQPNPLQVTALVKYWLGGPDPLDYVSMYYNNGEHSSATPPHWHYISCGFSDLHGDNRVHELSSSEGSSGYGFELTFRLQCHSVKEKTPPTWPAELLQSLARYVFSSDNVLCPGDHISWHSPLDRGDSRIQHLLLIRDSQLEPITSQLGNVSFIQVVGVTSEELSAAQKWNVMGIVELLKKNKITGGHCLVTNMRRGESIFDIDPNVQSIIDQGVSEDGSNLSGVSAVCSWEDKLGRPGSALPLPSGAIMNGHMPAIDQSESVELVGMTTLKEIHMKFNLEAAHLIPLALRGRVEHGQHFTFKSFTGDSAITLVGGGVEGSLAGEHHPIVAHGPWVQVYISDKLSSAMMNDVEKILAKKKAQLPVTLKWDSSHVTITIVTD